MYQDLSDCKAKGWIEESRPSSGCLSLDITRMGMIRAVVEWVLSSPDPGFRCLSLNLASASLGGCQAVHAKMLPTAQGTEWTRNVQSVFYYYCLFCTRAGGHGSEVRDCHQKGRKSSPRFTLILTPQDWEGQKMEASVQRKDIWAHELAKVVNHLLNGDWFILHQWIRTN